jgi:hypothetical protein
MPNSLVFQAIRAQCDMSAIQNTRGILYAGAWLRYGFHEDGFTSGLRAALGVGGDIHPPFDVRDAEHEPRPVFAEKIFEVMEKSGARRVGGWVGEILLGVVGMWVLFVRDFLRDTCKILRLS